MRSFIELTTRRRSIRQYKSNQSLSYDEINKIMKGVLMAPTSKNSRPWHFVLVEDKKTLKMLSVCKGSGADFVSDCALAVVVISDPHQTELPVEDATIAAIYIQLGAEDLNLGTCWVHVRERTTKDGNSSEQYVKNLLKIPNLFQVECIITIGNKVKESNMHNEKKLLLEKIHKERW